MSGCVFSFFVEFSSCSSFFHLFKTSCTLKCYNSSIKSVLFFPCCLILNLCAIEYSLSRRDEKKEEKYHRTDSTARQWICWFCVDTIMRFCYPFYIEFSLWTDATQCVVATMAAIIFIESRNNNGQQQRNKKNSHVTPEDRIQNTWVL